MNNYQKYLPSKKFISIILIIIIFITVSFAVKEITVFLKNKKILKDKPTEITVGTLIQKDSNNNGIADWEEYLWGLDPEKNGPENKEFIMAKKKTLAAKGEILSFDDSQSITDNQALSMQFMAAIISLKQTGDLNEESMKTIAEGVGVNVSEIKIDDVYTESMMTIKNDSTSNISDYHEALSALVSKYSEADIGNELTFIAQGISSKDPQALYVATGVAEAYQAFGRELIKIPVPRSLASTELSAANNYEKVGQSINNLTKVLADPLLGMRAVISYKKYNDALASDLEKISKLLQ